MNNFNLNLKQFDYKAIQELSVKGTLQTLILETGGRQQSVIDIFYRF